MDIQSFTEAQMLMFADTVAYLHIVDNLLFMRQRIPLLEAKQKDKDSALHSLESTAEQWEAWFNGTTLPDDGFLTDIRRMRKEGRDG